MDGTIPRAKLPEVLARMASSPRSTACACANVFHAGDGNLHPLILFDANKGDELERAEKFGADILTLCVEVGGVLTGEHGVGIEKRDLMPAMFTEIDLDQQQRLKCAFDDKGLLNPGKVFPMLHRCAELGRMHVHGGQAAVPRHSAVLTHAAAVIFDRPRTTRDASSAISASAVARRQDARLKLRRRTRHQARRSAGRSQAARDARRFRGFSGDRTLYEPEELVLTAGAGTPLAEIEATARRARPGARLRAAGSRPAARRRSGRRDARRHARRAISPGRAASRPGAARDHCWASAASRAAARSSRPAAGW